MFDFFFFVNKLVVWSFAGTMTIGKLKGLLYRLFKVDSSDQRLSSVDNKVRTLYTSYYSKRVVGDERRYSFFFFGISPFSQLKSFNVTVY